MKRVVSPHPYEGAGGADKAAIGTGNENAEDEYDDGQDDDDDVGGGDGKGGEEFVVHPFSPDATDHQADEDDEQQTAEEGEPMNRPRW